MVDWLVKENYIDSTQILLYCFQLFAETIAFIVAILFLYIVIQTQTIHRNFKTNLFTFGFCICVKCLTRYKNFKY